MIPYTGGVCARTYQGSTINNCINKATISATGYSSANGNSLYIGGITGLSEGKITNCYNRGNLSGKSYNIFIGGILGLEYVEGEISNSYNAANVTASGTNKHVGGVVGSIGTTTHTTFGTINNCYCTTSTTYSYNKKSSTYKYTTGRVAASTLQGYSTILEDAFTDDIQNEDETWQYNDGYPILKWQIKQ